MSVLQNFVSGLNVSALLMVAALGLVVIFGLMKVINMAHGELIMIGAYMTYGTTTVLAWPFAAGMFMAFLSTAWIGIMMERLILKKLYAKPTETLLATYAISLMLERVIYFFYGAETKFVAMPIPGLLEIGGITMPYYNMFIILFSLLLLFFTLYLFKYTNFGKKVRAITQNRMMSACLGIETANVDTWTFGYGAGLAGLAGALLAPVISVTPGLGAPYLTESFMTVVVGGVQSVIGTALGSVIIGEMRTVLGGFTNTVMAKIIVFVIIIIVIRFKPEGLFVTERR
ncbi:MAG: urea ABC transporter permease subunit UrtB [Peptococcaceae bacterium]|jgi:urea transport system permease protein|nr:urea ABC transporter permease subunit UrtB [Peptococcaceae bacterium]